MAVGEYGITVDDARRDYRRFVNLRRLIKFIALLLFCIFAVWTVWYMNMPLERLSGMFGRIGTMVFNRMMPPDLDYALTGNVFYSILETIEMSFLGTVYGVLLAVPVAWFGAWNVTPSRTICYPLGRAILVLSRAIPPIIWAMILVVILGFGPMAGTITLVLLTLSFAGKLMSEQVEAIDMGPVEAIRATGAGEIKTFVYSVLPQVKAAWIGIIIYNWDSTFRASTILGFVGAGGLGLYIRSTTQLLDYERTMGIILVVIVLVIASEILSHFARQRIR
ncbi:MAG TPA: phosphonate ABC transporter, permease protein PhnE [Candidatus Handelsmanbacteria bacterium]|nr:phosphonate ABC transporter, permease protein PhnE [Candidatus Handelsmanbacteria bacterium]